MDYKRNQHDAHLKRTLGIGIDEYDNMLTGQDGKCAICKSSDPKRGRKHFCVDHDHSTGDIRGLLCCDCNTGIGLLKDNPLILLQAFEYLDSQDTEDHNG